MQDVMRIDDSSISRVNDTEALSVESWKDLDSTSLKTSTSLPESFGSLTITEDAVAGRPGGPIDEDDMDPTKLAKKDPDKNAKEGRQKKGTQVADMVDDAEKIDKGWLLS